MSIYDRPVRVLMREMIDGLPIRPGELFTRDQATGWFRTHYPLVKEGTVHAHLIRLSTNAPSRLHYNARPGEDDVFFQVDSGRFRLYDTAHDPPAIRRGAEAGAQEPPPSDPPEEGSAFAYERDLREYLARNLNLLEPGLRLYQEEAINGVEFPVGGRFVDILAVDVAGNLAVIELKVSRGYDRAVGQLLRYMGWISAHQAEEGQVVRGIIVARSISADLILACSSLPNVELFEYQLSVSLIRVRGAGTSTTHS